MLQQKKSVLRKGQSTGSGRIDYIDGLKGLCCIWCSFFHYLLAFAIFGYIGWESGIPKAEQADAYFRYFPYSILSNSSMHLYIFFTLLAFLPAWKFFQSGTTDNIKRQAVIRYFRFMPPVLACSLSSWLIFACGGFFNQEIAALLGNTWDKAFYPSHLSLPGAVFNGLFDALWNGNSDYCSVLWCMNIIFFGSYMAYGLLLFFCHLRGRVLFYALFFLLTFTAPVYTAILGGVVAADILTHRNAAPKKGHGLLLVLLGLVIGHFPPVLLPSGITDMSLYGVGAFFVLLGCGRSTALQRLLAQPWLVRVGELSFAIVLVHFLVLMSFSAWFFLSLHSYGLSYTPTLCLTLLTAIPVIGFFALLFQRFVERPTERFAQWIYRKVA